MVKSTQWTLVFFYTGGRAKRSLCKLNSKIKIQKLRLQFKIQKFNFLIIGFSLSFLALPSVALGATLYFVPPSEQIYQGDVFSVEIRLDSKDEPINVVEADVDFSSNILDVISTRKTGSILRFWPHELAFSNALGLVSFIGGLPNPGFQDNNGLVVVIEFKAKDVGFVDLKFRDTSRVLLNNGLGSEAPLELRDVVLTIAIPPEGYIPRSSVMVHDTTPPDIFTPIISQTKSAFEGQYFVVFETQDRESGISHYEVQEIKDGVAGEWRIAVSPYVLKNQEGQITVFVKAVDRAGNEIRGKAEVTISKKKLPAYLFIILITILLSFIIWKIIQYIMERRRGII